MYRYHIYLDMHLKNITDSDTDFKFSVLPVKINGHRTKKNILYPLPNFVLLYFHVKH